MSVTYSQSRPSRLFSVVPWQRYEIRPGEHGLLLRIAGAQSLAQHQEVFTWLSIGSGAGSHSPSGCPWEQTYAFGYRVPASQSPL